MIMGHIGYGAIFDKWIHGFHMPMFFIISGYFYKQRGTIDLLKRRLQTLIIPYLFFGITHCLFFWLFLNKGFNLEPLKTMFWVNTDGMAIAGALWFLTATFFAELFYNVLNERLNGWKLTLAAVIVAVAGMALAGFLPYRLPWALDSAMVGVGLFHCGKLLKNTKALRQNDITTCMGLLGFSLIILLNGMINMREGKYAIWPLFWIEAVGLTVSMWNFSRIFDGWRHFILLKRWLISIGSNSITYLCLNQLNILIVNKGVEVLRITNIHGGPLLAERLLILAVVLALLYFENWVINHTFLKVVIGR